MEPPVKNNNIVHHYHKKSYRENGRKNQFLNTGSKQVNMTCEKPARLQKGC
jgi:hypothetical protein